MHWWVDERQCSVLTAPSSAGSPAHHTEASYTSDLNGSLLLLLHVDVLIKIQTRPWLDLITLPQLVYSNNIMKLMVCTWSSTVWFRCFLPSCLHVLCWFMSLPYISAAFAYNQLLFTHHLLINEPMWQSACCNEAKAGLLNKMWTDFFVKFWEEICLTTKTVDPNFGVNWIKIWDGIWHCA